MKGILSSFIVHCCSVYDVFLFMHVSMCKLFPDTWKMRSAMFFFYKRQRDPVLLGCTGENQV